MLYIKDKIGIYAPDYYKDFKCIAGECRHSCCIDWEICIDECTYEKYKKIDGIFSTVAKDEYGASFVLRADGRCPHLNDDGLCNIILSHGEDYLSQICQNHPRFYNYISENRVEAGLGIVCEEACRLILENENTFSLSETDEFYGAEGQNPQVSFDAIMPRNRIISILQSEGSFYEKLDYLKAEFNLPQINTPHSWLERFLSLEILDENWEVDLKSIRDRGRLKTIRPSQMYGKYYERLLCYFVYRHVSVAKSVQNFRARLAFCILSVEMIGMLFEYDVTASPKTDTKKAPPMLIDWARRYSAEIEYSEDNTDELIFAFESAICKAE